MACSFLELFASVLEVYFAIGIWFPKFRGPWGQPPVVTGRVTHIGAALFPGALGVMLTTIDIAALLPFRPYFILTAVAGANLAILGAILDRRAYFKKAGLKDVSSPISMLVFGILFFILCFYMMFIHKNS